MPTPGRKSGPTPFPPRQPLPAGGALAGPPPSFSTPRRGLLAGRCRHARPHPGMAGTRMLALDAATGQPSAGFGEGGFIDVGVSYGGSVTVAQDVAVIGAATLENPVGVPGNPRAFDARTGRKLWEFQTVPQEGQPHNETWGQRLEGPFGHQHVGVRRPGRRAARGRILPIAGPAANYYGGDRPGSNLFGNSLVAGRPEDAARTSGTSRPCTTICRTSTCPAAAR